MKQKTFYITTAIDYANSSPHLGTAFEKIGADVIARYHRLAGYDVFFLMGNDEHSQNVRKKAEEVGMAPKAYCDEMALRFKDAWAALSLSFDDFIQTSEPRHHQRVQEISQRIFDAGFIYKAKYRGLYCVSCEAFYGEKDLPNGICPNHQTKPEFLEEENYFFKLSHFTPALKAHFKEHPEFLRPSSRRNEILALLDSGLDDISISRPSKGWGIPLPFDPSAVAYVWFDALVNYISALGDPSGPTYQKFWPANVHVIGKDITRFHAVVWPAMLMAAKIEPPKGIWAHGFVSLKGEKMSKSRGNVADPLALAKTYGSDVLRYHLMREVPWDKDGDFSEERLIARYNADLANDLGNLLSRSTSMIHKYQHGRTTRPDTISLHDFRAAVAQGLSRYHEAMDSYQLHEALEALWNLLALGNRLVEEQQPWALAKQADRAATLNEVLYSLAEVLHLAACCLAPFMPETSNRMLARLHGDDAAAFALKELPRVEDLFTRASYFVLTGAPLFPRMEEGGSSL